MKRIALLAGLAVMAMPMWAAAQTAPTTYDHVEVGAFGEYLRFAPSNTTTNYTGVGGRLDVNVSPNVAMEAQMSYDFAQNYTSTYSGNNSGGISTNFVTTSVRPITGFFGPKLQFGTSGPVRAFLTGQVGFIDFSVSNPNVVSGQTFTNSINGIGGSGTHLAVYPGGGLEFFAGPIGIRADIGDDIYFNNGTYNNLRVTFGPSIRF